MEMTLNALSEIRKLINQNDQRAKGVRISLRPGKYRPEVEIKASNNPKVTDHRIFYEDVILFVNSDTKKEMAGYTLDHGPNGFKVDFLLPGGKCCR